MTLSVCLFICFDIIFVSTFIMPCPPYRAAIVSAMCLAFDSIIHHTASSSAPLDTVSRSGRGGNVLHVYVLCFSALPTFYVLVNYAIA